MGFYADCQSLNRELEKNNSEQRLLKKCAVLKHNKINKNMQCKMKSKPVSSPAIYWTYFMRH